MDLSDTSDILSAVGDALEASAEPEKIKAVTCTIEHALLPEHLADYTDQHGQLASTQKAEEKDVQALRARHHGVARLLAEGVPEGVIAKLSGYTEPYISTLKNNPAMIELVQFYRQPKTQAAQLMGEKLRILAEMSADEMMRRLESDEANKIGFSELATAAKLGFDRSGNGPNSTVTNVQEHRLIASEELEALGREARRREQSRIVDVEVVRNVLPAPSAESDNEEAAK
jgi:hypothetical protein